MDGNGLFNSGSYAIVFFSASDFIFSTRYIHATEHHFHFSPAASFFLELLTFAFFSSPIVYFLPFHTVHGVLSGRILKWVAISSSSGPYLVRTLHYETSVLVALHSKTHSFIELCNPLHQDRLWYMKVVWPNISLFLWFNICKNWMNLR